MIIGCCILLLAGVIAKIVVASVSAKSVDAINGSFAATAIERDLRIAGITTNSADNGCSQQIFDNQSGRMLRSQKPYEVTMYDIEGAPVPLGAIHRLDANSKSFSGH